ncbi:MAG TPA: amylo-alpha-1,6-glucosidase [Candidatus Aquilonibacter sp.]|nr:amylo-alpha-1,6-glucosidase [Candidatus Aquilonibacter sp.]
MDWGHLSFAEEREWLVTDGAGGFASGTVSDVLTRRYHGLLVAATQPPVGRRVLLAKLDASIAYAGVTIDLGANRWRDGSIAPSGFRYCSQFALEGRIPVWSYAIGDALLEKRVWMPKAGTTCIAYNLANAGAPSTLTLKAYVNDRDYHALTHAYAVHDAVSIDRRSAAINLGTTAWHLSVDRGTIVAANEWYYGFELARERERGLDDVEDHYHACTIVVTLAPGESVTLVASTGAIEAIDGRSLLDASRKADAALLERWRTVTPHAASAPAWVEQLVLAADSFIVDRNVNDAPGKTIIAGYHWFGDWGRDTMIALPGLTLSTGRAEIARSILATFARYVDRGMLPNRFPDGGDIPEYNSVDAALWFVEATRAYVTATGDLSLARDIFDALDQIVECYARGTRYGIAVDDRDGLLRAGEPGVQLTWMDAKVGDWVVTPRIGKPVEINALWYNALCAMDSLAQSLQRDSSRYRELGSRARASFARFWNPASSYLFDVLDGPDGDDPSIRPNALIAVALPFRALDSEKERAIVACAARSLVTPGGVRSLSPDDASYIGHYGGDQRARDGAYHRGTAWPWLIGAFLRASIHAHGSAEGGARYLQPFAEQVYTYGMGTVGEIADGDAPYDQRGCIAQAWSVAEILRAWHELDGSAE